MTPRDAVDRVARLVNLLRRGQTLHYDNAVELVARGASLRLPPRMSDNASLVYTALQIVIAFLFIEDQRYLTDDEYDRYTDRVFAALAGARSARVHGLVDGYAKVVADLRLLERTIARDLAVAFTGSDDEAVVRACVGAARAVAKTTQLYCAMTFDDQATVRRLS